MKENSHEKKTIIDPRTGEPVTMHAIRQIVSVYEKFDAHELMKINAEALQDLLVQEGYEPKNCKDFVDLQMRLRDEEIIKKTKNKASLN